MIFVLREILAADPTYLLNTAFMYIKLLE